MANLAVVEFREQGIQLADERRAELQHALTEALAVEDEQVVVTAGDRPRLGSLELVLWSMPAALL